jgi:hypothetical protein
LINRPTSEAESNAGSSNPDVSAVTSAETGHAQPQRLALTAEQTAAAAFVAEMSAELLEVARRHGLRHLAYLLDLALLEAKNIARHDGGQSEASGPVPS